MSKQYYALISSLPDLSFNDKSVGHSIQSFKELLLEQLDPSDYDLILLLFYPFDILNFVHTVKELDEPWDERAALSKEEIEEGIRIPELLPEFFQNFILDQEKGWEQQSEKELLDGLTSAYLNFTRESDNNFIRQWVSFEQNLKNLLIWLNARKFKRDVKQDILGENFEADYLRQTEQGDLNLKAWDNAYKTVLTHYDNPDIALRELMIDQMRWDYLIELEQEYYFDVERLYAYAIKLRIVGRNTRLTEKKGKQRLDDLLKEITENYSLPETFTT
ncbi:MAG: DUF2764 domain-containing protein [Schleiferiaceae bacterium]|nr:DUF2764 domain-containing protein [Schleiferiaceae bacterium]